MRNCRIKGNGAATGVASCVAAVLLGASEASGRNISLDLRPVQTARTVLAAPPSGQDGAIRSNRLDAGAADAGEVAVGDRLTCALFDDVAFELMLREKMQSPFESDAFLAEVSGYEGMKTAVVLRTAEGLTLDVQDFRNDKVYRVVSMPTCVKVSEIVPSRQDVCGCVAPEAAGADMETQAASLKPSVRLKSTPDQVDTCVDVLVAYDKNATAYADGEGGMTNFALVAVQKMNAALANTGLDEKFRFRLVGVCSLDVSAGGVGSALTALEADQEGWKKAKAVRDEVGADIVTTLIDNGTDSGNTGISEALEDISNATNFASKAYNVCTIRSVMRSHTMTHECGHLLGAGHAREQATERGPQCFDDYSAGYFFTAGGKAYATIMAYEHENPADENTVKIPFFSSPLYTYEGVAVGTVSNDNTRTLADTFSFAVGWRKQEIPMSYDISFSPASGTVFDDSLTVTLTPGKAGVPVRYTLDGSAPTADSPLYTGPITLTGTAVVRAATCEGGVCAIPYEAVYYVKPALGDALGRPESGGDAEWTFQDGGVWQSGPIGDNGQTWIQTTVAGAGRISFEWRSSSEFGRDELSFFIDGKRRAWISGAGDDWRTESVDIATAGAHVLKWMYAKDGGGRYGSDCGWIRNVAWERNGNVAMFAVGARGLSFNGYALDGNGTIAGTFVLLVKKPKGATSAATLTFTSLATGKKTKVNGSVNLYTGAGGGALAGLTLGAKTVGGTVEKVGLLSGGLDAAKAKDAASLAVLAKFNGKGFVIALAPENPGGNTQGGCSSLSIMMAAKGKAKIAGVLADGTKVSASGVMTVGDAYCTVPVVYAKKSRFGFVARFDKNTCALVDVIALTPWKNTVKPAFTMPWTVVGKGAKGSLPGGPRTLELDEAQLAGLVPGAIPQTPSAIPFSVKGTKWVAEKPAKVAYKGGTLTVAGANVSDLKLTYTAKTGLFKGSFTVYSLNGGKLKRNKFSVFGAVTDGGTGYGTALLKRKGSATLSVR